MKAPALIPTAMISLCAGTAMAACPGKLASNGPDTTGHFQGGHARASGIAKLPVSRPQELRPKDGTTMPLATKEGGGNKNLATSQQGHRGAATGGKDRRSPCQRQLQRLKWPGAVETPLPRNKPDDR